jgi:hypothetical protein
MLYSGSRLSAVLVGESTRRIAGALLYGKKRKAALTKKALERAGNSATTGHPAAKKTQPAKQMEKGQWLNHVV